MESFSLHIEKGFCRKIPSIFRYLSAKANYSATFHAASHFIPALSDICEYKRITSERFCKTKAKNGI